MLAWGAVNAVRRPRDEQVDFKLDYSGGWGTYKKDVWRTFANSCGRTRAHPLPWRVMSCTAKDGSHWGLQAWQRMLPNYGLRPARSRQSGSCDSRTGPAISGAHRQHELGLPEVRPPLRDVLYDGTPVHGFRSTPSGNPLDTFGRNLYVDTFNSAYGLGWKRENSFLMHKGTGTFCYGFYPHGKRPAGHGERYRATIIGPGVTPDVMWQGNRRPVPTTSRSTDSSRERANGRLYASDASASPSDGAIDARTSAFSRRSTIGA